MKINIVNENSINIEGLTSRQLALLHEALYRQWWEYGDYKINVDENKNMLDEFGRVNVTELFNLKKDREEIQKRIDEIMKDIKFK